jgi:hypothetical protein
MRAFLLQISKSGPEAESGLKVIAYFDALVEHRATLEACVRAAAALSQCVAGLRDSTSPLYVRFNRRGMTEDGPPAPTTTHIVRIGEREVGEVWLERADGPSLLDELIVERMALAAGVLWRASPRPNRSAAGLIELVVSPGTAPDDRHRALELLGFSPNEPLDFAAVASGEADHLAEGLGRLQQTIRADDGQGRRAVVCSALVGEVGALLGQPGLGCSENGAVLDAGFVAGTARGRPADHAADAWQKAQTAMQFCGLMGLGNLVDFDDLGSLATLATLPQSTISADRDVRAIAELAATTRGQAVLQTLEQWFASGSIREAAARLYLHHSSVRYRLRQAEKSLGLDLEDPRCRLRLELALILWRLSSR